MKAIDFVVRTSAGAVQFGEVAASGGQSQISAEAGSEISLNLRQADVAGYARDGSSLEITLADGRVVVIEDYFSGDLPVGRLFISADGYLNEVTLIEGSGDAMFAQYGPTAEWGKWSPDEALIFLNEDGSLIAPTQVAGMPAGDDEVSMLAALPLLGGFAGGGAAAAAAAAVVGGGVLLGGGGGGTGGGGGGTRIEPSVNEKDPMVRAGDDAPVITITGTAEPGSAVTVVIGGETVVTTATSGGTWSAEFSGTDFPVDGDYDVAVNVREGDGRETDLTGPNVIVDTTPPDLSFREGTQSVSHVENLEGYADGVTITGQGEAGSSIAVTVKGVTKETTVLGDGSWSVEYSQSEVPGGEYTTDVVVVTTDAYGNSATYTDQLVVDTVPHPISVASSSVGGNGTVNFAEEDASGVTVTGTPTANAVMTVVVTAQGQTFTQTVATGANGTWSANWPAGTFPGGEYDAQVKVSTVDGAGNASSATGSFRVDTLGHVAITPGFAGGNEQINADERAEGLVLTGTAEAGSTSVIVAVNGVPHAATVGANGNWTVTVPTASLPEGERQVPISVTAKDAAGNSATANSMLNIDTLVNTLTATSTPGGVDQVINAAEHGEGVVVTGRVEPGSSVMVKMGVTTVPAIVAADGTWTATFSGAQVPTGDMSVPVTATAKDAAGNVRSETTSIRVDTIPNRLALSAQAVESDNVINFDEAKDGVEIKGTSEPNAVVQVSFGSGMRQVVTNDQGQWSASFTRAEIPADTAAATVTATTSDAAGNVSTVTGQIAVDTVVQNLGVTQATPAGTSVINGTAAQSGMVIRGTTEPGSKSVEVTLDGKMVPATINADGTWSAPFSAANMPTGEKPVTLSVRATDKHGNVDTVSQQVQVDTFVNRLDNSAGSIEGDNVVNRLEASDGVRLTGKVEAGSRVNLVFEGATYAATVSADGTWAATIPAANIRSGDYTATVLVQATDAAGNHAEITRSFAVDTIAPDGPLAESYTRDHVGISRISVLTNGEDLSVSELRADNSIVVDRTEGVEVDVLGETLFSFSPRVPDGSHLIINSSDAAGNTSGTYLVLDEATTSVVDLPSSLRAHQIEAIDLQFAEDSQLTITEAQLKALSTNSDTVTIHGGVDDTVTARGAVAAGSVQVDGQGYVVYTLGADGRLIIDEDISVVI